MAEVCILLASPRTGTTVLGSGMSPAFAARWLGELFDEGRASIEFDLESEPDLITKANFFNFRSMESRSDPTVLFPSPANQRRLFERYLNYLNQLNDANQYIADIKYTSWHHFDPYWHYPQSCPALVELIKERQIPVIHVQRRNLFAQYCSLEFATQTDTWHRSIDEAQKTARLRIHPKKCDYFMKCFKEAAKNFEKWFDDHKPFARLTYEELFDGDGFSARTVSVFSDALGRRPKSQPTVLLRKVTPPLRDTVTNMTEIRDHFQNSPFLSMIEEAMEDSA